MKSPVERPAVETAHSPGPVVIVGAGFGGLCLGVFLKRAGIEDFLILERADEVGGTWRDNRYPGAACDVPSHLYSFSFEPNPRWTRTFASQAEILEYLVRCSEKFGLRRHIRFATAVERFELDERAGVWWVHVAGAEPIRARAVVSACGGLSRPSIPRIAGLETFEGQAFHSARWDANADLSGKEVAVVGTGASAIQIVPQIAKTARRVYVFQRTPPWIMPKGDRPISAFARAVYRRAPWLQQLVRLVIYWRTEMLALAFVVWPKILKLGEVRARIFLRQRVRDPSLRAKLVPRYAMGCKRILPTNDYYPALSRESVELVVDSIEAVLPRAIRTCDGRERAVQTIVLATGFQAAEPAAPFDIVGRAGRRLSDVWSTGAEAYLGTTVRGFPNLFFVVGPNTGLGHSSMVFMIESQARYIASALRVMRAREVALAEVRAEVQERYNARLRARMRRTVWATGCTSWYMTAGGKNTVIWPGFTFEFRMRTWRFDARSYELRPAAGNRSTAEMADAP